MAGGVIAPGSIILPMFTSTDGSFRFLGLPFCPEPAPLKNPEPGWEGWCGGGVWW